MLRKLKNLVILIFPYSILKIFIDVKKRFQKHRYNLVEKIFPTYVTKTDLIVAFRTIGIEDGEKVFVHSSLSKFGTVVGGATIVIEALQEVTGETGMIAMPAYPFRGRIETYIDEIDVFDVRKDPSLMGVITETFRKCDGTVRSSHPTHSVCAKGFGAKDFVEGHQNSSSPFGSGSPFEKVVDQNFTLLLLGVDFGAVTIGHVFQDRLGTAFPFKVYEDKYYSCRCIDMNGNEHTVKTPVHSRNLNRIDNDPKLRSFFYDFFKNKNLLCEAKVGKGQIISIKTHDYFYGLEKLFGMGVTSYGKIE